MSPITTRRAPVIFRRPRAAALAAVLSVLLAFPACAQNPPLVVPAPSAAPSAAAPNPGAPRDTGLVRPGRRAAEREPAVAADAVATAGSGTAAFRVERRMEMRSTAYCLRGMMRTGVRVRDGMAAADPNVLPLGSVVRVSHPDGRLIGVFVVMDTGGAVRGNKLDLWFPDCGEASDWGTRSVVAEVIDIGRS